jgi:Fe-S-cluster containining protein
LPNLEIDIAVIQRLAQENEDENWRFRSFLKSADLGVEELDAIVHELFRDISAEIDCRACGNCCRSMGPVLSAPEVARLTVTLGLSETTFTEKYLVEDEHGEGHRFRSEICPFLTDKSCSVYPHRPDACRSYPHLHKDDFVFRLIGVVNNCSVCPIVFHVYEGLKDEIRHRRVWSHFPGWR